jgi:hypothetical protein
VYKAARTGYNDIIKREKQTMTGYLPHQTAKGPQNPGAWKKLLATAPRGTDSAGRPTIQVCTASGGRGIFATVEYATNQTKR